VSPHNIVQIKKYQLCLMVITINKMSICYTVQVSNVGLIFVSLAFFAVKN
jgi:hypothetical protein